MGRRTGGGGGRSASAILRRRIESCGCGYTTVEELVDFLRSNFPDYRRTKCQPFTRLVQQTLDAAGKRTNKSAKRFHDAEDRIMRLENEHVKRRRKQNDSDRPSTSPSSSTSSDEEEGSASTSEDAVYGKEVEPEFDLMKLRLRDAYSQPKDRKLKSEEKNIEFEVSPRKIHLVRGEVEMKKQISVKGDTGSSGQELKGKEGPRFQDLGGMENVLEELKMEVIVPLYHPQLPQWLGVRPMSGILLHGPPGCGKTKLAHAIANETGVPFYKISATEVVSGVSGTN